MYQRSLAIMVRPNNVDTRNNLETRKERRKPRSNEQRQNKETKVQPYMYLPTTHSDVHNVLGNNLSHKSPELRNQNCIHINHQKANSPSLKTSKVNIIWN